jgi:hypothetical protein
MKSEQAMFCDQQQDDEIPIGLRDSSNTQIPSWQGSKQQSFAVSARVPLTTFHSNLS